MFKTPHIKLIRVIAVILVLFSLVNISGCAKQASVRPAPKIIYDPNFNDLIQKPSPNDPDLADPDPDDENPIPDPDIEPILEPREKISSLKEKHPDVVGYLIVSGTKIDLPVVQGTDNEYFLTHTYDGKNSKNGAAYLDAKSNDKLLSQHAIIHGHNRRNGTIFSELDNFKKSSFFKNNKTFIYENLYYKARYEIFAVCVVNETEKIPLGFANSNKFTEYQQSLLDRSLHKTDFTPDENAIILTLHTCTYDFKNAHLLISARLIEFLE